MITWIKQLLGIEDRTFGARRSGNWPRVRKHFLMSHPACEICGTTKKLEVHHIVPFWKHPELEESWSNLITLCETHHYWFAHLGSWRSINKDIINDVEIWREKINNRI